MAAAFAGVMGAGAASAAIIDFTDNSIYTTQTAASASGSFGGFSFTITGSSPNLTYESGPGPVGGLAGDNDGIGIGDDEIGDTEYLTITFDRPVRITGVSFLDLFSSGAGDSETASVYVGTPPEATNFVDSFSGTEVYTRGSTGFGSFALTATGDTFTFDTGAGNDGKGIGDFSLASIEIAAIPLPATALLLGAALLALPGFGRRWG